MGATKKPTFVFWDGSSVGQKDVGKVKPTPKPTATAAKPKVTSTPKPKAKPSSVETIPSLAEYKKSAAANSMSYKEYINYFKRRGAK